MNTLTKIAALLAAMTITTGALKADEIVACKTQIQGIVNTTYRSENLLTVKPVRNIDEFRLLHRLEKKALLQHLKLAKVNDFGFAEGSRHAVSLRTLNQGERNWIVADVVSDNSMGLTRTIQIYAVDHDGYHPQGLYFDDQFNQPIYHCK